MSGAGADSLTHAGSQAAQSPGGGRGGPLHRPFSIVLTPQVSPNPEKQRLVKETGQFYPSYTIAHYRLSKKTPLKVNHQIQDEKILICKSAQAFLFGAEDGREGTDDVSTAASPLGQVRWQALHGGAVRKHPAFRGAFVCTRGAGGLREYLI